MKSSHAIASLWILSLQLLTVQCGTRGASNPRTEADTAEPPDLRQLRAQGNALFRAGEYLQAGRIYENGYEKAKRNRNLTSAVRFLNNLGSANYQMFRYRDAIQAYLEARDLATSQGDREMLGALSFNLSSLYLDLGDFEAASESAEQGLKLPSAATSRYKAKLLIQRARIQRRKKDPERAAALLQDAVEASRAELDMASEAQAWNELGETLSERGQLESAEHALLEACRLRKLTHDDRLYFSYTSLGQLRVLQGDLQSASELFDRAMDLARLVSPAAIWNIYYEQGKVKLAQMRLREAFADFGAALKWARRWRAEVLPADAFRVSTEVELHEVYSSFIELGGQLYAQTGEKQFAEKTFAAAEESRAASLRALWAGPDLTKKLPYEYWDVLAHLYKDEAALVKGDPGVDTAAVRRLRLSASEMEARAGLDFPRDADNPDSLGSGLLERTRRDLRPAEVFLGFYLGDAESCVWIVARQGFEFRRLAPRAYLAKSVDLFVKAVRENSPEAVALGNRLYGQLFSGVSRRLLDKPIWIVAPDGPLFELPFAALVEGSDSRSDTRHYVVERHAIQVVPGIWALLRTAASDLNGPVVGVGDPIYNRADPRLPHRPSVRSQSERPASGSPMRPMELARLAGSGREIANYDKAWRSHGYEPILLSGAGANRENLMRVLQRNPAVLHIAAHFLFPPRDAGPGVVALSLQPAGEIELLTATEIASMRLRLGLVVLNGCSSAHAATLPGAGLMGMTRAWLAAGARGVIVTRWATSDQVGGELFRPFYERLSSVPSSQHRTSFAQILQQAQLAELRAGGRRANPSYWAAYFCVERN